MQKTLLIIQILIISCNYKPNAKGLINEINIIISDKDKYLSSELINNYFQRYYYYTPQKEYEFKINYYTPYQIKLIQNSYNLLFISLEYPNDSTGDLFMNEVLKKNQINNKTLFTMNDVYANNQIIGFIKSYDLNNLYHKFENEGEWLIDEYKKNIRINLSKYIFSKGYNITLSNKVKKYFNSDIKLQPDFKIIKEDKEFPYLWIGRGVPFRWLTIHKGNKIDFNKSIESWNKIKKDLNQIIPSIKINEKFRSINIENTPQNKMIIMRGLYEHEISQTGGPFFFFIFESTNISEVILVGGFVNNPGNEKLMLIKQLEIIAKTLEIN